MTLPSAIIAESGEVSDSPDEPDAAGGSVTRVPPLPSEAKSSEPLKSLNVMLALLVPSVTASRPVEALYDSAKPDES